MHVCLIPCTNIDQIFLLVNVIWVVKGSIVRVMIVVAGSAAIVTIRVRRYFMVFLRNANPSAWKSAHTSDCYGE